MNITEWANIILSGGELGDKLFIPDTIDFDPPTINHQCPRDPARNNLFQFSEKKYKFPKVSALHDLEKRRQALHTFANHELMAIEIFAAFFLLFPYWDKNLRHFCAQLVTTLKEEQVHFQLYQQRLLELGGDFGEFPVNDFFWKQLKLIKEPQHFFSIISLSFEAANLDFALYYKNIFLQLEDDKTARVLQTIHDDEIKHVALGRKYIQKNFDDLSLWEGYLTCLPTKFSPARGKGIIFDSEGRSRAGLDNNFIGNSQQYKDTFSVVNRKQWKK